MILRLIPQAVRLSFLQKTVIFEVWSLPIYFLGKLVIQSSRRCPLKLWNPGICSVCQFEDRHFVAF